MQQDRRVSTALMEHKLGELQRDMSSGFVRLEGKIDGNLETLSGRIEREAIRQQEAVDLQAQRAIDRAESLAQADSLLAERVEGRLAALEADTLKRVDRLEKWKIEVDASVKAIEAAKDSGVKTKHLWIAAAGLLFAFGGLVIAAVGVIVTVLLSA